MATEYTQITIAPRVDVHRAEPGLVWQPHAVTEVPGAAFCCQTRPPVSKAVRAEKAACQVGSAALPGAPGTALGQPWGSPGAALGQPAWACWPEPLPRGYLPGQLGSSWSRAACVPCLFLRGEQGTEMGWG